MILNYANIINKMQKLTQQMLNNVFVLPNIPLHLCIVNQYSYKNNVLFLVKKVFNILLSLFIAITATNAQVPVVLDLSDASADVGNTISIDVTVKNFNEILGGQFTIKWDATAITFLNEPYNFGLQSIAINNFNTTNAPDGELRFGWIADVNGESLPDDAVLFSMDFLIDEKRPVLIDFDTDELA
ncbi:MAG: cohesin domain-containing protein, partial [Saprospiraceae bacterium]